MLQVESFHRVEGETLVGGAERHAAVADRVGAFREKRSEALSGALEDAKARIESEREPRRWRRQRRADQMIHERGAELTEIELKGEVEMGRMQLFTGQCRFAVNDQSLESVDVREQRGHAVHR